MPNYVRMFFSENRHDREIYWSGFGFQVWLQVLTHILSASHSASVVIDEPDVYLHPDLQRRLTRFVSQRFQQTILATHAVEIINEVDERDVVSVNARFRTGKRIAEEDDFQKILAYLGSVENVAFSRLSRAKKVIFFEGDDSKLLRRLAKRCDYNHFATSTDILVLKTEGFSQAVRVKSALWAFEKILELKLQAICLFDRDYRCSEEVAVFLSEMSEADLECHVLERKEIENYFLDRDSLIKTMQKAVSARGKVLPEEAALAIINEVTADMRFQAEAQLITHYVDFMLKRSNGISKATLHEAKSKEINQHWADVNYRFSVLPGKKLVGRLSSALDENFGSSLTFSNLIDDMPKERIDKQLKHILDRFEIFCKQD